MSNFSGELDSTTREVGNRRIRAGEGRTVVIRRSYASPIEDVWDALTSQERIGRWFLPVTGDLRLGGTYQLEGNAGGEILHCEPPHRLTVTWVFGENPTEADVSEVEVRLSVGASGETVFELEHAAVVDPARWAEFGPGAVGVGWDLALLGLGLHLRGESIADPGEWMASPQAGDLMVRSSTLWGAAHEASGASAAEVKMAVENTARFYVPNPPAGG